MPTEIPIFIYSKRIKVFSREFDSFETFEGQMTSKYSTMWPCPMSKQIETNVLRQFRQGKPNTVIQGFEI